MAQRAVPMAVHFVIGTQTFTRKFRRRFICLQSARGLAQSKTLRVFQEPSCCAQRLGVWRPAAAFPEANQTAPMLTGRHTCFGVRVEIEAEEAAIMVFCPEEYAASTTLRRELKELAEGHGLTFLDSHILRDDWDSVDFVNRLRQQKQPPQPVVPTLELSAELSHPPRYWGINE